MSGKINLGSYGSVAIDDAKSFIEAHGQELYGYSRQQLVQLKTYAEEGNWTWKVAGFIAALSIVGYTSLSLLSHVFGLSPVSAILDIYLIALGVALAMLEYKERFFTQKYLDILRREALFIYRPYGRAAVYVFVGALMLSYSGLIGKLIGLYTATVGSIVFYSSREAFKALGNLKGSMHTEEEAIARFREFDKDNSNTLDSKELAAVCKALGTTLTLNELESALFVLDRNGDGKIELQEFLDFWKGKNEESVV